MAAPGVGAVTRSVQSSGVGVQLSGDRPFCIISESSSSLLLFQSTGSSGLGPGHVLSSLEGPSGICVPSLLLDFSSSEEDQGGPGELDLGGSLLADETVVFRCSDYAGRPTSSTTSEAGPNGSTSVGNPTPSTSGPALNRLAVIGEVARS